MALLANPALLLLDEPTTGLDVTVEAAVLDLHQRTAQKYGTALLYISHNLGVIAQVCERVGVMYSGRAGGGGARRALFATPRHPYTRGLLACVPAPWRRQAHAPLVPIPGSGAGAGARREGCGCPVRRAARTRAPGFATATRCRCSTPRRASGALRALGGASPVAGGRRGQPAAGADQPAPGDATVVMASARPLPRVPRSGTRQLMANDGPALRRRSAGTILAIVGESGSGKSTFARSWPGSTRRPAAACGWSATSVAARPVRRRSAAQVAAIQMVFQNPDGTLNPSHTVGWPIARAPAQVRHRPHAAAMSTSACAALLRNGPPAALGALRAAAPALGRAEAAHRHRARLRRQSRNCWSPTSRSRRSTSRCRRRSINLLLRIQAEHDTTLRVHQPRPRPGALPRRRRRGDVSRAGHGSGAGRRALRPALSPLHRGAALRGARARSDHPDRAHPPRRRDPEPAERAARAAASRPAVPRKLGAICDDTRRRRARPAPGT